jgi:hypothetical protein
MSKKRHSIVTFESVSDKIIEVRGQKVILDFAVAELYGTETKEVNRNASQGVCPHVIL